MCKWLERRNSTLKAPRGGIKLIKIRNGANAGKVYARLDGHLFKPDKERAFSNAQEFVDSECLRYMNPLTPRLTGMMIKSATLGTVIGREASSILHHTHADSITSMKRKHVGLRL